jgi:hypothetical protein
MSFDGRSRNHLTALHEMGEGEEEERERRRRSERSMRAVGIIPAIPSEKVGANLNVRQTV